MPYIDQEDRDMAALRPVTPGELNYALTNLMQGYLARRGPVSYQYINDVIGALEAAKAEFYRRVVVPYEERKRAENGDVYP